MTEINDNVIAQSYAAMYAMTPDEAIEAPTPMAVPEGEHIPEELVDSFERLIEELDEAEPPTTVDGTEPTVSTEPNFDNGPLSVQVIEELDTSEPEAISGRDQIPLNRASLQVEETTSRFRGAIWYDQIRQASVLLAGVGGIGSYVAFLLSRLKLDRIMIYDGDRVETGNLSGQMYRMSDVGKFKSTAMHHVITQFSDYYRTIAVTRHFNSNDPAGEIMMCGFDSMEARKMYYERWKTRLMGIDNDQCLFIDGRLAAEEFQVFAIKGDDIRAMRLYEEKWLFSDEEAEETLCSYKQTSFMANMIASVMVNIFVNFIANQCDPVFPRDVPFLTQYDASTMMFKVDM